MRRDQITKSLWEHGKPLFFIIDTARAGRIGHRTETSLCGSLQAASLYDGKDAIELNDVEPVLCALSEDKAAHTCLIDAAWGRSWGVYLTSSSAFSEVAAHLRRLIKVQTEDGELMYFRYYDPRVLRVFLPTCTAEERKQFFGPVQSFWVETEEPADCLVFHREGPPEPTKLAPPAA